MKKTSLIVALTTVADDGVAAAIARTLIEERLAACVQRMAIASTYAWEGRVEDQPEVLLVIKTTTERRATLRSRLLELHPYETPEYVVLEASEAADAYLAWARASTASDGKS